MNKKLNIACLFLVLVGLFLAACGPATSNIANTTATSDYVAPSLATTEIGGQLGSGVGWLIGALVVAGIIAGFIAFGTEMRGRALVGSIAGLLAFVVIFGGAALTNAYVVVEPGNIGVVVQQGTYMETANPGQHWIVPFLQKVVIFPTREFTFSTLTDPNKGSEQYRTFTMDITTSDGVQGVVKFQAQVSMNPAKAKELYEQYGTLENAVVQLVKSPALAQVRDVLRGKTALDIVTKIDTYNSVVEENLKPIMAKGGLTLIRFAFRKPDLGAWETERNAATTAEQTKLKAANEAEVVKQQSQAAVYQAQAQANISRETAQGLADSAIITAKGQAEVTKLNAEAEAKALLIKKEAEAKTNQDIAASITAQLIEYLRWSKWDGKLPIYSGSGTPLFSLP